MILTPVPLPETRILFVSVLSVTLLIKIWKCVVLTSVMNGFIFVGIDRLPPEREM